MNELPRDIIINHIIPYTYSTQDDLLQRDIKTYVFTLDHLKKIYLSNKITSPDFPYVFYFNIVNYCNENNLPTYKLIKPIERRSRYILAKFNRHHRLVFLMGEHYIQT